MAIGDTFISGDYLCTIWGESFVHIQANDKTKVSYATPPRQVTYNGSTYLTSLGGQLYSGLELPGCFENCKNLKIGPNIPARSDVITESMSRVYKGCTSLTSVGSFPANVHSMTEMFSGCSSLITAPTIPSSVDSLSSCFEGCTSLSGEVVINATDLRYLSRTFYGTEKGIWLTGSNPQLQDLAATANNGNVFVGEIPLDYSLTAERVGSDGGTTPEPEGNWLHLVASITWSNFAANSIDSMALMINGTSISATAYTDATKTEAITLPGWQPAANTEAHAWVQVDADTQVITFTISDAYHTGAAITFTVPQVFRTFDFLAGGKGIAAGAVAEEEGFHFAMEPFFRTLAGMIQMFAGATPPNGWLLCDGSEQLISDYPELYAAIENTYGTPSDSDHFLLPDLRGRFPLGIGDGTATGHTNHTLGQTGGNENLIVPSHNHTIPGYWSTGSGSSTAYMTTGNRSRESRYTGTTGSSAAGANMPPYIGLNFIIHTGRPTIPVFSMSLDLVNHGEWVDSGTTVAGYPVYQSNASYNVNNAWDTAKITFTGTDHFDLYIRSYAEGNYDYALVSQLDNDYLADCATTSAMRSAYSDTAYTKAYTRGKQSATDWELVQFTDLDPKEEYYFYVIFQKDNSTNSNDDRGYFYIPM